MLVSSVQVERNIDGSLILVQMVQNLRSLILRCNDMSIIEFRVDNPSNRGFRSVLIRASKTFGVKSFLSGSALLRTNLLRVISCFIVY